MKILSFIATFLTKFSLNNETGRKKESNDEDFKWITLFQKGKKMYFDKLVIKYKDNIYNLSHKMMKNNDDAEDVAQETFIKLYKAMNKFKFQSAFYTYLYRICINTCKTKLGIRYSLQRGTLLSLNKNNLPDHEIESNHPTPEKALGNKTLNEIFKKTISKLPSPDKEVLILRDIEGLSYTEISEITNLNLGTIKSKISRSRTKLKSLMEKWL